MRNRLARWLEEINKDLFNFTSRTLISTLQTLDEYLSLTDEHFSQLQLIGCACLYMNAKIYEKTIIAGECYVECSNSVFSKQELVRKEAEIFEKVGQNINYMNTLR